MSAKKTDIGSDIAPVGIDWADLHRRLAKARTRLKRGDTPDGAATQKRLQMRAATLAIEPVAAESPENHIAFLDFTLGEARFGVEAADIREVSMITELLPVPGTPSFVAGIINMRGHIVSVLDLKNLFQLPAGDGSSPCVLLIGDVDKIVGILADSIGSMRLSGKDGLQRQLPTLAGYCERYLTGVTPDGTVILNTKELLSDNSIVVHAEVEN